MFFGRDEELERLTHRVRASRMVVLYGRSGLGKTSLLQAGLYPRLRQFGFLPIPIRFNQPAADVVQTVIDAAQAASDDPRNRAESEPGRSKDGLWMYFRSTDVWRGDTLLTPVLILDQFEEVFTLQDERFRQALASQLRDLAGPDLPKAARQQRMSGELPLRVIISLREEYLGALDEIVVDVPNILDTRFRLLPLDESRAGEAIEEPAALRDAKTYHSSSFTFDALKLGAMLTRLANRTGEFEPFQLQLLCQEIEQRVVDAQAAGETETVVDEVFFPDDQIDEVLSNFYGKTIGDISTGTQRRRARRLCERGLLSGDDKRVSIEESGLQRVYKLQPKTLRTLVDRRLVRKDTRPGLEGFYYELSHDSLVEPVRKLRARSRLRGLTILAGIPALLLVIFIASFYADVRSAISPSLVQLFYWLGKAPPMPDLVKIPAGRFMMGSDGGYEDERPIHEVEIAQPFYLSATEVTFAQYDGFWAATGREAPDDGGWGRGGRPVINVSWKDAVAYAEWLSDETGAECRLPLESEWEYAARAGSNLEYWWGDAPDRVGEVTMNTEDSDSQWSGTKTAPVGQFPANPFGLHDMQGNVWEWTEDCWHESYEGAPTDGRAWGEEDNGDCSRRVVRGGSWVDVPRFARSAYRYWFNPEFSLSNVGFRVLCSSPIVGTDH
ncbi:MAG: SUMF1/EgtB/PvdO family nonheme iron enzyme [Gammaproteobacteria bacterium]